LESRNGSLDPKTEANKSEEGLASGRNVTEHGGAALKQPEQRVSGGE